MVGKVLITGSADGLGRMAAQQLVAAGHEVVLHARDRRRADDALSGDAGRGRRARGGPGEHRGESAGSVADQANAAGRFDAVIHNAAVGFREPRIETVDGLEHVFAINVLAPYLLTALITAPDAARVT